MTDRIDDVTIVGGGDSGLLTALALRKLNPDLDVSVVDDFDRPIPQIGKSTFLEIRPLLHERLDIDEQRFVEEVKPVWKGTAYFREWCGHESFHYPFDIGAKFPTTNRPDAFQDYFYWYDELYRDPGFRTVGEEIVEQRKSPWSFDTRNGRYDRYDRTAYHLSTDRFNAFLREICRERDVSLIDDELVAVESDGERIDRVRSKRQSYESDLYIDSTGFNRLLLSELDRNFRDFGIPLDSAWTTTMELPLSEVVPATVIDSGEHGWFWQIDTYDHRDVGYVFSSEYVDDETALDALVEHADGTFDPDEAVKYEFTSGYYDPAWAGNCIGIGNAAGSVEPLQSTGLTFNAKAGIELATLLSTHGRVDHDFVRDSYNDWVHRGWETIYDFIAIHYAFASGENEFWQRMQEIELSDRVELLLEEFDRRGLDRNTDPTQAHPDVEPLTVYNHMDFYIILRSLGVTSSFYENGNFQVDDDVRAERAEMGESIKDRVSDFLTTEEAYNVVVDD